MWRGTKELRVIDAVRVRDGEKRQRLQRGMRIEDDIERRLQRKGDQAFDGRHHRHQQNAQREKARRKGANTAAAAEFRLVLSRAMCRP